MNNEIDTIYITYNDRFVRFGYYWFESFCGKFDTKIIVLNNPDLSPQQELVEDLVSIIHVFSCRIYGLRKYKKRLKVIQVLLTYKTELNPNTKQKQKINATIGTIRYIKNMYLAHNNDVYANGGKFVSAMTFSKWLNNTYLPMHPDQSWIKKVSSKAIKQGILNTEKAFKQFFQGKANYPQFKKKNRQNVQMYFVKNDSKTVIAYERHRIKIPTLGWVKLKEKGYLPKHDENQIIKSGTVSIKANRYYVSVLVEVPDSYAKVVSEPQNEGHGYDFGITHTATGSNGAVYENINKSSKIRSLEKRLRREQRRLSRKYESEKRRIQNKEISKGESTRQNIQKQTLKVQKIHQQLTNIRNDFQNKIVHEMAKTKPGYITIEDLNISGMMKNRHLSKAISQQKLYGIRMKLEQKAKHGYFELRMVHRFYPSSKLCHCCGSKKIDLRLSDRIYKCDHCGYVEDRDVNASFNLRDAKEYEVIA